MYYESISKQGPIETQKTAPITTKTYFKKVLITLPKARRLEHVCPVHITNLKRDLHGYCLPFSLFKKPSSTGDLCW